MTDSRVKIKVGIILTVVAVAIAVPLLMGLSKITDVDLTVQYPYSQPDNTSAQSDKYGSNVILNATNIKEDLYRKYGDLKSYKRNQIQTKEIKQYLEEQKFVKHAIVSVSMTGVLRITIIQKLIVARFDINNVKYYLDDEKNIIRPDNDENIPYCIVIGGDFKGNPNLKIDSLKNKDCFSAYKLAMMIEKDKTLKQWISGIAKNKKQWFLLPAQGDYTITLSDSNWTEELEKLHNLIEYSFKPNGWADYKNIDLRFHNQVVCSK